MEEFTDVFPNKNTAAASALPAALIGSTSRSAAGIEWLVSYQTRNPAWGWSQPCWWTSAKNGSAVSDSALPGRSNVKELWLLLPHFYR